MKKVKIIVAALFIVAVGAAMFWACQKEETTTASSVTAKSKKIIHKNANNAFFFYESNPNVFYRVTDSVAVTLDGLAFLGDAYMKGEADYDDEGHYLGVCCEFPGFNCGDVVVKDDNGSIIYNGLFVAEQGVIYLDLDCTE